MLFFEHSQDLQVEATEGGKALVRQMTLRNRVLDARDA